jgi:hypothetical protein
LSINTINLRRALVLLAGAVAAAAPATASAAAGDVLEATSPVEASVTRGPLKVTAPSAALSFAKTLDGTSDPVGTTLPAWTVEDDTGDGLGWSVSVGVSTLTDSGQARSLPASTVVQFKEVGTAANPDASNTGVPQASTGTNGYIDLAADSGASAQQVAAAAADKGMGAWTFPEASNGLRLVLPSTAKSGDYTGTITFTLAQGDAT